MKDVLMNEDICDRMLAEIRKAHIVVADFTEHKHGVYFEAGFARALGREVFWTCRDDHMAATHFDTDHYQHVVWSTPADLRAKLSEKIMAVVGPGPEHQS
jgi:nucleoside 2-deoxyribosyltransferase